MRLRELGLTAAFLTALAWLAPAADDDFQPLVQGTDIAQFELVKIGPETMQITGGEIAISGKPNGYFATKKAYRNYVLRFEWKYERPAGLESDEKFDGNSGLLVHIEPPHKVWPKCIEVQLANKDAGNIFAISGSQFKGGKDAAAQKRAIKPVGEWNQEEVTCKDGSISCKINGIEVAHGTGASPDHGHIGLQSEGRPIHFRNLMIKAME
jgi:3-keto-disaccharide hydrolase